MAGVRAFGAPLFTFLSDDGIVVGRSRTDDAMEFEDVSPALRERLGPQATVGLLALLDTSRDESAREVSNQVTERFERESVRSIGGLREELRQGLTSLRLDIAGLRAEMREGDAAIRLEMRDQRAELLKWSFAFWFGQFVGLGGLMAILLRG